MRAYYSDHFVFPLPPGHRFPVEKYVMLRDRVGRELPRVMLCEPSAASADDLVRVHDETYVRRVAEGRLYAAEERRLGFPWSPELVERARRSVGGTIEASFAALEDGVGVNLAGGTHHALPAQADGFCVFNDVAVAIRRMQAEGRVKRCAVIDCDVHQGNGTAQIFEDDDTVFTFSVHCAENFPFDKAESDLDLSLDPGADDDAYIGAVRAGIDAVFAWKPDLVYYVAGADAYAGDRLGRLHVSREGMAARDQLLFDACAAARVPVVVVMAGGYAVLVEQTVDIHFNTVRAAYDHACRVSTVSTSR